MCKFDGNLKAQTNAALHLLRERNGRGYETSGGPVKIVEYALVLDGGPRVITLQNSDEEQINFGLDGRMDSPSYAKQLFIRNFPDGPETRLLEMGGAEEGEMVALLECWLDQIQDTLRREALMQSDPASLKGPDVLDRMGLQFLLRIKQRDVSRQAHAVGPY